MKYLEDYSFLIIIYDKYYILLIKKKDFIDFLIMSIPAT
jgi:hypothetical protein